MAKFISKSANLHIVLEPGIPAQPISGTPAKPTVSVRFQDGIADVHDEELVKKMMAHPGYNVDFISAEEDQPDPYAYLREDTEPTHVIEEMQFGHPTNRNVSPSKKPLPPKVRKMIQDQATEIAKQMLPSMVEAALKDLAKKSEANSQGESQEASSPEEPASEEAAPEEAPVSTDPAPQVDTSDAETVSQTADVQEAKKPTGQTQKRSPGRSKKNA